MYNGIGLTTPRGSGTNGFISKNLSFRPNNTKTTDLAFRDLETKPPKQRKPNAELLEHQKKRAIEVKVTEWAVSTGLFDSGISEEEIQEKINAKREELTKRSNRNENENDSSLK